VLWQSGVAGGNSMGDILEGVVRDRFGPQSYERVESGAPLSRKHAAVKMFNDKTKGRFVFLIDSRACLPSIKLSRVDAIIIYNSDCNPLNDLKALQRIKIESQHQYPGIFRLYTPFTMEEKQLVLAKHGMPIDKYKDIPHSLGHSLISWGVSFLFNRLDELQHDNYASKSFERRTNFMDEAILEFLKILATNSEDSTDINYTSISKANMSGEFYSRSITLVGENVAMPALDEEASNFWLNLLDGKSPCGSNISEPPQSSHRMIQNIEEPAKVPAEDADEARRKRRKVDRITVPSSKRSSDNSHDDMLPKNCSTLIHPPQQLDDTHQKEGITIVTRIHSAADIHITLF
jgi:chromodomain-helicase-DNA-binding protein 4